jgi:hypothetical protein
MGLQPIGFLYALISCVAFGSNFVVTKKYKTGDGIFFQWTLCSGIFLMGVLMYIFQCSTYKVDVQGAPTNGNLQCPAFEPFAMLGGVLWATGNMLTVPIVKTLGLSLGMLTWGMTNMVIGWASARFGWLGVLQQTIGNPTLNVVGVTIAILSMGVFYFIKPSLEDKRAEGEDEQSAAYGLLHEEGLDGKLGLNAEEGAASGGDGEEKSWTDNLTAQQKTTFGFCASVVAGLLYGVNFNPPTYVANHMCTVPPSNCLDSSGNQLTTCPSGWKLNDSGCYMGTGNSWDNTGKTYIFSHFAGIWLTSTVYFLLYAAATKNTPAIFGEATFPGVISGMIWATAQISWFYANASLGQATSFPIIA